MHIATNNLIFLLSNLRKVWPYYNHANTQLINYLCLAYDEIVLTNYENYGIQKLYWDIIAGDATHIPFRITEMFDVIITDRKSELYVLYDCPENHVFYVLIR